MKRLPSEEEYSVLEKLEHKVDQISINMEKMGVAEYVEMLRNPRRLFFINFWSGVARGFGMAIGFTILAAVFLYFLQRVIVLNIPLIGDFVAEIVQIVQTQLSVK